MLFAIPPATKKQNNYKPRLILVAIKKNCKNFSLTKVIIYHTVIPDDNLLNFRLKL